MPRVEDEVVVLTPHEMRAVAEALLEYARLQGDDLAGVFVKQGSFRYLPVENLVSLAGKIEKAALR